ncbi:putative cyclin [Helianthus annuus]|nr:putative cyclin [Helianthus annuus]
MYLLDFIWHFNIILFFLKYNLYFGTFSFKQTSYSALVEGSLSFKQVSYITQSMRGVLVDWLVEVSVEYKLEPYTLHRTIYLIDMFLSKNYIERQKLQLLGIICMLIAS